MTDRPLRLERALPLAGGFMLAMIVGLVLVSPQAGAARLEHLLVALAGVLVLALAYLVFSRRGPARSFPLIAPLVVVSNTLVVDRLHEVVPQAYVFYIAALVVGTTSWGVRRSLLMVVLSALGYGWILVGDGAWTVTTTIELIFASSMFGLATLVVSYFGLGEKSRVSNLEALERERLANSLARVGLALSSTLDVQEVLDLICRESMAVFGVHGAYMWLKEGAELVGTAAQGRARERFVGLRYPLDHPQLLGAQILRTGRPSFRNRVQADQQDTDPDLTAELGVESILAVPISKGQEALGSLVLVDDDNPDRFSERDLETVQSLGNQAALAIHNARLYQETLRYATALEAHTQHLTALAHIAGAVGASLDLRHVLQTAVDALAEVMGLAQTGLALLEPDGRQLVLVAEQVRPGGPTGIGMQIPVEGNPSMQRVLETKRPLMIEDAENDPLLASIREIVRRREFKSLLIVPLLVRGQVVGTIGLDALERRSWTQEEVELAEAIAHQVAAALENARLYEEKQSQLSRLTALSKVSEALNQHVELSAVLGAILRESLQVLQARHGTIVLVDEESETLRIHASVGISPEDVRAFNRAAHPVPTGTFALSVGAGQIVEVDQVSTDPRVALTEGMISGRLLNIPLRTETEALGAITLDGFERPTDESIRSLLKAMADIAAVAIQRATLYEQARRRTQELSALYQTSQSITSSLDLRDVLETIARQTRELLKTDASRIYLIKPETEELEPLVAVGQEAEQALALRLQMGEGITGWVARSGVGEVVNDAHLDPRAKQIPGTPFEPDNLLIVPLVVGEQTIGVMTQSRYGEGRHFDEADLRFATALAAQAAVAIRNAQLYDETVRLAITDALTGVYNRRYLFRELEREIVRAGRYERPFALMLGDIDAFKTFNDRFGHLVGDAALRHLAGLFGACIRDSDIVARYGGEEFVFLLPETGREGGLALLEKLVTRLQGNPFEPAPGIPPEVIRVSFGLAVFPEDGRTPEELIEAADRAMYVVKRAQSQPSSRRRASKSKVQWGAAADGTL